MTIGAKLIPASFRGTPFLVPAEDESGGKKVAIHEYPGSDRRFVEELGLLTPTFSMSAVVHGDSAVQDRSRLIEALTKPGPGVLVHPYRGSHMVTAVSYRVKTSDTELGRIVFQIDFKASEQRLTISASSASRARLFDAARSARSLLFASSIPRFKQPTFLETVNGISRNIRDYSRAIFDVTSSVTNPVSEGVSSLLRLQSSVQSTAAAIASSPARLFGSLQSVNTAALSIFPAVSLGFSSWRAISGYRSRTADFKTSEPRTRIARSTVQRIELDDANLFVDQVIRISGLINMMEAAGDLNQTSSIAIADLRTSLDRDFTRVMVNVDDVINSSFVGDKSLSHIDIVNNTENKRDYASFKSLIVFDEAVRTSVLEVRDSALALIDQRSENAWRIDTEITHEPDLVMATYGIYGSIDLLPEISSLNPDTFELDAQQPIRIVI